MTQIKRIYTDIFAIRIQDDFELFVTGDWLLDSGGAAPKCFINQINKNSIQWTTFQKA